MKKFKLSKRDYIYLPIILAMIITITLLAVFGFRPNTNSTDYYSTKCASYAVQNTNLSKGQIVFLGDSITDLYPLDDYYADLDLATYNRGIGGDTTLGVINRMQVSVLDLEPSQVVLMIGINDFYGGRSASDIVSSYDTILKTIKDNLPECKVHCMSILSQSKAFEEAIQSDISSNIAEIININTHIQSMAASYGYTYHDLFSATEDENHYLISDYTIDGIHLSAAGFAVWTNLIKDSLR